MSKLLPCPFCGGEAALLSYGSLHGVFCGSCDQSRFYETETEAIKAWNTRAADTSEEIVRCRDCKYYVSGIEACWYFKHDEPDGTFKWNEIPAYLDSDGFCAWGERRDA